MKSSTVVFSIFSLSVLVLATCRQKDALPDEKKMLSFQFLTLPKASTTYRWNYGDGSSISEIKGANDDIHTYSKPGTYTITVNHSYVRLKC